MLGGGIIGLEMATVYHELGSSVSVVELMDQLIPGADKDIVTPLARRIAKQYEAIWLGTKVTDVEAGPDGLTVSFDASASKDQAKAPATATFDAVLVAVGRRPNGTRHRGGQGGRVRRRPRLHPRRQAAAHQRRRTSSPSATSSGSPCSRTRPCTRARSPPRTPRAKASYFDATVIPSVAYTDPEVAWVGVTENEAKAAGVEVRQGHLPVGGVRAVAVAGPRRGPHQGDLRRGHRPHHRRGIVGPNAGDLIAEAALAIEIGADAADIGLTIHPHPTLSETVAMAAEAFEGTITDLYLPKKPKAATG